MSEGAIVVPRDTRFSKEDFDSLVDALRGTGLDVDEEESSEEFVAEAALPVAEVISVTATILGLVLQGIGLWLNARRGRSRQQVTVVLQDGNQDILVKLELPAHEGS